jgi:cytochrome c oxidase subunit 2
MRLTRSVCTGLTVLIVVLAVTACEREQRQFRSAPPAAAKAAVAVTAIILFVLLVLSVSTGRGLSSFATPDALHIEVIGHQWWWEVHYADPVPSQRVITANEIHIPVGRPIVLQLTSHDVIHNFWAPNLHGKRDLIPGHITSIALQADKPGAYRGQCAEFCGYQHTYMAFLILAEPAEQFAAWLERQRGPAVQPTEALQQRGQEVFLAPSCVLCHTIQGTSAAGKVAPDLTHIASRHTIAAGTLPNTTGHLAAWIIDPQHIKPGNKMPPNHLDPDDLQALLAYLESLK